MKSINTIQSQKRGIRGEKQLELQFKPPKKSNYSQDWSAYNLAQTSEKLMFLDILRDLCNFVKYRKHRGKGRPKYDFQDMIFCMALLTYIGKSSRRTISELTIAKDLKYIDKVPHFNTVLNFFNDNNTTKHLKKLIELSSYPLKNIEQDLTIDSSGFATTVFARWHDYKWGKSEGKERTWVKAHVMSGVKTNIITSISVTSKNRADTTEYPSLLKNSTNYFQVREVSADKAYLSRHNLQFTSDLGIIPYIPFKSNTNPRPKGSMIWRRMFNYFSEHQEEFMEHYHKRSNAETVFSMIKKKFGMSVRTKTHTAQVNEVLCKALCHNICVLIQETFELGISTDFTAMISRFEANPAQVIR